MENASKALIIAGAILIALLIISLGIFTFSKMSDSAKKIANLDKEEIQAFNSKLTPYTGENISGSQVNSLIQYVISVNNTAVSAEDTIKIITITYPAASGGNNTISVVNGRIIYSNSSASRKVKTGGSNYYKVKEEYSNDTGLINKITVEE